MLPRNMNQRQLLRLCDALQDLLPPISCRSLLRDVATVSPTQIAIYDHSGATAEIHPAPHTTNEIANDLRVDSAILVMIRLQLLELVCIFKTPEIDMRLIRPHDWTSKRDLKPSVQISRHFLHGKSPRARTSRKPPRARTSRKTPLSLKAHDS